MRVLIGTMLALAAPAASAQPAALPSVTELMCKGQVTTFPDQESRDTSDLYVRVVPKQVYIAGDIVAGEYQVARVQETVVVFTLGNLTGNLSRFSGDIWIAENVAGENRVKWSLSGKCQKAKALF